jgi:CheY-like chemotaxis protein
MMALQGQAPDAILADYRLEAGDTGLEAIRAIHACLGRPIPATIITGDTAPERLIEARSGGFRLLHKPVALHDLHAAVSGMLRDRRRRG